MADPFVAEIRIFPFNFAPKGWAWCDGQLLPLSQNTALFSLLGTTYGGNGKSNFALPDLQGDVVQRVYRAVSERECLVDAADINHPVAPPPGRRQGRGHPVTARFHRPVAGWLSLR